MAALDAPDVRIAARHADLGITTDVARDR